MIDNDGLQEILERREQEWLAYLKWITQLKAKRQEIENETQA